MRYLCIVEYDGTSYAGWQIQPDAVSIQETIEKVLSKILNIETKIYASGRTDAGVHAYGQTFHFNSKEISDTGKFLYSLNSLLPDDIYVTSMKCVDDDFNARISAIDKTYIYILNMGEFDLFNRNYVYQLMNQLNIEKMIEASKCFLGEHNFQNFTSKTEDENNFTRVIYKLNIEKENNIVTFTFNGNGFMKYMIRFIVGTLIQVGLGKLNLDEINNLINTKERHIVSYKAPANGLYLVNVNYMKK